jgi:hypothetical protein
MCLRLITVQSAEEVVIATMKIFLRAKLVMGVLAVE